MTRDRVIWSIISVASASFALGILFLCAVQRSLAHDETYSRLLFLLIPLCLLSVVVNTRRVIKALPQGAE
jgi:hypothetical protein